MIFVRKQIIGTSKNFIIVVVYYYFYTRSNFQVLKLKTSTKITRNTRLLKLREGYLKLNNNIFSYNI